MDEASEGAEAPPLLLPTLLLVLTRLGGWTTILLVPGDPGDGHVMVKLMGVPVVASQPWIMLASVNLRDAATTRGVAACWVAQLALAVGIGVTGLGVSGTNAVGVLMVVTDRVTVEVGVPIKDREADSLGVVVGVPGSVPDCE